MLRQVTEHRISEDQVHEKWQAMSPLIDRMMERVGTKGEFPVAKGSSLAGDDRASNPYQISHALQMCLTAGVDHLHAVKVLVLDQGVIHVAAPSSLVRGALESFSAAYWMLGPTSRNDRVLRTLQWYAQNFKDGDKATRPLKLVGYIPFENKMKKLCAVAAKRGIAEKSVRAGYTSTTAVTFSEANAPDLPLGVVLPWQLCSGFAHGRPWAYLGVLNREEQVSETDPNLVNVRLTSDLSRVLHPSLAALQLLERFLRLYETRSGNHLL
jgi:hypothetical protein